jgi:hypothetical protein
VLSRSIYSFAIALIELGLIAANCYIAANWGLRDEIFIAAHYNECREERGLNRVGFTPRAVMNKTRTGQRKARRVMTTNCERSET